MRISPSIAVVITIHIKRSGNSDVSYSGKSA
jgi:hypothetical protein